MYMNVLTITEHMQEHTKTIPVEHKKVSVSLSLSMLMIHKKTNIYYINFRTLNDCKHIETILRVPYMYALFPLMYAPWPIKLPQEQLLTAGAAYCCYCLPLLPTARE